MKTVVICGSKKFKDEIYELVDYLESQNVFVYEPNLKQPIAETRKIETEYITDIVFKGLTLEHFDKIRKADVCLIYNKGGYVGISVTLEMAYASALSKPIFALEKTTGDPCRNALIDKVINNPKDILKYL
jgi:hypothetical protein